MVHPDIDVLHTEMGAPRCVSLGDFQSSIPEVASVGIGMPREEQDPKIPG